jgi:hypothetical protein
MTGGGFGRYSPFNVLHSLLAKAILFLMASFIGYHQGNSIKHHLKSGSSTPENHSAFSTRTSKK